MKRCVVVFVVLLLAVAWVRGQQEDAPDFEQLRRGLFSQTTVDREAWDRHNFFQEGNLTQAVTFIDHRMPFYEKQEKQTWALYQKEKRLAELFLFLATRRCRDHWLQRYRAIYMAWSRQGSVLQQGEVDRAMSDAEQNFLEAQELQDQAKQSFQNGE